MPTLTTLIAAALVKLGLQVSREQGWYPRSFYVKAALDALRQDDFERAIEELGRAWRAEPGEDVEVAREVILMRLDAEMNRVDARAAEAKKMRDATEGEITTLDLRLRRLRFTYRPVQAWVAGGAAAVAGVSTFVSVAWFGLSLAVSACGLAAVGAGAALLVGVDLRRQRAAHEAYRAQVTAEVAEETQILRAEIRKREADLAAAGADRERVVAMHERLPGRSQRNP